MSPQSAVANPFMLLVDPDVVLAAVEKSAHLNNLNRHMCRPLDKPTPSTLSAAAASDDVSDDLGGEIQGEIQELTGDAPTGDATQ